MKTIPLRGQLALVGAGYAVVLAVAASMVLTRYLLYLRNPHDVTAGGMYATGDIMLAIIIVCMLMVPTFFLALIARHSESLYTRYSKSMLGLSLTAPLCGGLLMIPAVNQGPMLPGEILMDRLICSPILLVAFLCSRLMARFDRAKRLTLYALLIEFLTLAAATISFFKG